MAGVGAIRAARGPKRPRFSARAAPTARELAAPQEMLPCTPICSLNQLASTSRAATQFSRSLHSHRPYPGAGYRMANGVLPGCLDHLQQHRTPDQLNGLAPRKRLCIAGECTHTNDLHCISAVVGQQTHHLPYHAHPNLPPFPLLALDEHAASVLAKDEIDPSIGPTQARFLHAVPQPSECLTHQLLELAPAAGSQALQSSPRIEKDAAMACGQIREQCCKPAETQYKPGKRRNYLRELFGEVTRKHAVLAREPPWNT